MKNYRQLKLSLLCVTVLLCLVGCNSSLAEQITSINEAQDHIAQQQNGTYTETLTVETTKNGDLPDLSVVETVGCFSWEDNFLNVYSCTTSPYPDGTGALQSEQLYYSGNLYTRQKIVDEEGKEVSFDGKPATPSVWTDIGPLLEGGKNGIIGYLLTMEAQEDQIATVTQKQTGNEIIYKLAYTSEYLDELIQQEVENRRIALENYMKSEKANEAGKATMEAVLTQVQKTTLQDGFWTVTVNKESGIVSGYCLQFTVENQEERYTIKEDVAILDSNIPNFEFPHP